MEYVEVKWTDVDSRWKKVQYKQDNILQFNDIAKFERFLSIYLFFCVT